MTDLRLILNETLNHLLRGPKRRHVAAFLAHESGYSLREVGEMLGVTPGRVRQLRELGAHTIWRRLRGTSLT